MSQSTSNSNPVLVGCQHFNHEVLLILHNRPDQILQFAWADAYVQHDSQNKTNFTNEKLLSTCYDIHKISSVPTHAEEYYRSEVIQGTPPNS